MKKMKMTAEQGSEMFPIGTEVKYYPVLHEDRFEETKIRSIVWPLGHGELVVKVEGRTGGVAISHLEYL